MALADSQAFAEEHELRLAPSRAISAYRNGCVCSTDAMPTWSHASSPFTPWPGPPTPTQPATCPAATFGARVGVIVARTPCPVWLDW